MVFFGVFADSVQVLSPNPGFGSIYILLDVLVCSIAVYFYELCGILTSP